MIQKCDAKQQRTHRLLIDNHLPDDRNRKFAFGCGAVTLHGCVANATGPLLTGLAPHAPDRPAKGRHFGAEIIISCVVRYLRYALSLSNLEAVMAERNVHVDHVTNWRWIQRGTRGTQSALPVVKKHEGVEDKERMMVRFDEEDSRGALVSVCDWDGHQQLLLQNEYLLAENRFLRAHLPSRLLLTGPERSTLAVIGKRLGRRGLELVASAAKPDTILACFRKLVAQKFDGSHHRLDPGRPPLGRKVTQLIVRMARETATGDTIASPERWTISAIASPITPGVTSYAALVLLPLPSVANRCVGLASSAPTWLCWQASIFSLRRCSLATG